MHKWANGPITFNCTGLMWVKGATRAILDFYHAAQNLWKGARAWLDGRSKKARQWFASARHRLRHGETNEVLSDIVVALELDGLPETARKALKNLYEYLDTHHYYISTRNSRNWACL